MKSLIHLLQSVVPETMEARSKFFNDSVTKALTVNSKYWEDVSFQIEIAFDRTKDESKRIFLIADFIRYGYVESGYKDIQEAIIKGRNFGDPQKVELLNKLSDWITEITHSVDCYEVAKALITKYKKEIEVSNKKNKKNLTLLKKSA